MCGITSDHVIEEARAARDAGNMPRYAEFTRVLMDEFGLTVEEIRHQINVHSAHTAETRDPRMPIPESEWPRPRYGFVS